MSCVSVLSTVDSELCVHVLDMNWLHLMSMVVEEVKNELVSRPPIVVYGKACHQRRDVAYYSSVSVGYHYSTSHNDALPLGPMMGELLEHVNRRLGSHYNGVLVNRYVTGDDYIGAHSDDEKGLDATAGVVILSYGQPRTLRIRDKQNKQKVIDIELDPHYMVQMRGHFQREFTHEIPIQRKRMQTRYSFTFRSHCV